jgi:beta propeller repeat protein
MIYQKYWEKIFSIFFLLLILVSSAAAAASLKVTETRITTNPSNSQNPVTYGDNIVWQDDRNRNQNGEINYDIYMGTLSSKPPLTAAFSASQLPDTSL